MGRRVRQFRSRIEQLSHKSAAARVAHALVDLADEYSVCDARGTVLAFRLSQRDLANLVGVTRETVNMVLGDFQRQGLAEEDRRVIRPLDIQKLQAIASLRGQKGRNVSTVFRLDLRGIRTRRPRQRESPD
jgi:CRP-like cAMP-binding protein